ncbi:MAG: hypothetical protein OJF49_004503 [Ktedonobacterales bacterium]|jgi:hypothetical protein|nr:MAG: hypothetical protein OJF49_004503 [Ktedonobacterales bacterium]
MHDDKYYGPPSGGGVQAETSRPGTLTVPSVAPTPSPLEVVREHDLRRRKRLLRILALGVMIPVILLIPAALIPTLDRVTLVALIIAFVTALAAYGLNEWNKVDWGGFALLGGISLAIAWEIVAKAQAQHGIDLADLRLFDLFALPIALSGVVIGRRGPVIIGAATITFTIVVLLILPHTRTLQLYWNGQDLAASLGSSYDVFAIAVVIQGLVAVASWLGADSVRRAQLDASRADELVAANAQIQAQARASEAQRYRLEQGIAHIQQVHAAVARGQWDTRAHVNEGELIPVAMSLNLLLDRLSRMTREAEQQGRIERAAHELAMALRRLRAGEPYTPPNYTGTAFDEVLVELSRLRDAGPPSSAATPSQPPPSFPSYSSHPSSPTPVLQPSGSAVPSSTPPYGAERYASSAWVGFNGGPPTVPRNRARNEAPFPFGPTPLQPSARPSQAPPAPWPPAVWPPRGQPPEAWPPHANMPQPTTQPAAQPQQTQQPSSEPWLIQRQPDAGPPEHKWWVEEQPTEVRPVYPGAPAGDSEHDPESDASTLSEDWPDLRATEKPSAGPESLPPWLREQQ